MSAYTDELATTTRTPIYGVVFTDGTTTYAFTSARVKGADATFSGASEVLVPISYNSDVDPVESRFTLARLRLALTDASSAATPAIAAGLDGWKVTFYEMFWDLAWPNHNIPFTGIVTDTKLNNGTYIVEAKSAMTIATNKRLFDAGATDLVNAIGTGDTIITVTDLADWSPTGGSGVLDPEGASEKFDFAGVQDNGNDTWNLTGVTRGQHSTTAATHAAAVKVREMFVLTGHPFDILKDIFEETTNPKTGLDMAEWIDTTDLATQKTAVGSTLLMRFEITCGDKAMAWIEREIFVPMSCYPYEDGDGQLKLKLFDTVHGVTFVGTVTDAHAMERPKWEGAAERQINSITIEHEYDTETRLFNRTFNNKDQSSIDVSAGKEFSLLIPSQGIQTSEANTATLLANRSQSYLDRFGSVLTTITARTRDVISALRPADAITATLSDVISLPAATRTLTNYPFEITAVARDFRRHTMVIQMLGYPSFLIQEPVFAEGGAGEVHARLDDDVVVG